MSNLIRVKATWLWRDFHLEEMGGKRRNWIWKDPEYGGDNSYVRCETYGEALKTLATDYGRDKGVWEIQDPDIEV